MRKIIAAGIVAVALGLTGCAAGAPATGTPVEKETGYEIDPRDLSTFEVTLPSGKKVECVAITYRGSALQCWPVVE